MSDSPFNSVHLHTLPRRQDFRRARDILMRSRGERTLAAERAVTLKTLPAAHTTIETGTAPRYVLRNGESVYPLRIGLNTIGRFAENDVVLPEGYISRRHCAIVVHAGSGCELHDLASKNGTLLNGQRLARPTWLVAGDQIRLCDRLLVFSTEDAPAGDGTLADF
jgi:pSer/pThr/pTyr-binding forkhead associated (FHA) protein